MTATLLRFGHRAAALLAGFALTAVALAAAPVAAPADVAQALAVLPAVEVVETTTDGIPTLLRGDLGRAPKLVGLDLAATQRAMRPALASALAALRLQPADLRLRKVSVDETSSTHLRYQQTSQGLDVIGGDLVVHVDSKGSLFALNGSARGDLPLLAMLREVGESVVHPAVAADRRFAGMATTPPRRVWWMSPEGVVHLAYETIASGQRGDDPVSDKVYVDATSGVILAVHPQIHHGQSRRIYSANNGYSTPGTLKRTEGQAATTDAIVNAAYDGLGNTWAAYWNFWNRDSYNGAGIALIGTVHYSSNYCNAFWTGTQMVFGDGNSSQGCQPLALGQDVTAHELTHAVTENESNLTYSRESGGLNEAMSDIFGAFTEAWVDGGKNGTLAVSANTWKMGEKVRSTPFRFMNDPAADGASADFYTSSIGNLDVHYSSGVANLAFYLLSQGGTHPRGKSTLRVTGIGMAKAIRLFYYLNTYLLTSNATFLRAGTLSLQAAASLGYTAAEQTAVADAWRAVGVMVNGGSPIPAPTATTLTNGVAVTGLSDVRSGQKLYKIVVPAGRPSLVVTTSGGIGDADLYVQVGVAPTLSNYKCRSDVVGNTETCTLSAPVAGTYYVLLNAYSAYSGLTLKATY